MNFTDQVRFEFKTPEHAQIACRTLSVDEELKPEESISTFSTEGNILILSIKATSEKALKKVISTTTPSVELIQRVITEFALN